MYVYVHMYAASPPKDRDFLKKKTKSLLTEYMSAQDINEAVLCVRELGAPDFLPELVCQVALLNTSLQTRACTHTRARTHACTERRAASSIYSTCARIRSATCRMMRAGKHCFFVARFYFWQTLTCTLEFKDQQRELAVRLLLKLLSEGAPHPHVRVCASACCKMRV